MAARVVQSINETLYRQTGNIVQWLLYCGEGWLNDLCQGDIIHAGYRNIIRNF
jgi:hypothetical protein